MCMLDMRMLEAKGDKRKCLITNLYCTNKLQILKFHAAIQQVSFRYKEVTSLW